jgi:uncharacterized membrane protein (DUF4010 family)
VLVIVAVVRRHFPGIGVGAVSALAGLVDVDAITLSLAQGGGGGGEDPGVDVASAILIAALANTLSKGVFAGVVGSPALRGRMAIATAAILASGGAMLAVLGAS